MVVFVLFTPLPRLDTRRRVSFKLSFSLNLFPMPNQLDQDFRLFRVRKNVAIKNIRYGWTF